MLFSTLIIATTLPSPIDTTINGNSEPDRPIVILAPASGAANRSPYQAQLASRRRPYLSDLPAKTAKSPYATIRHPDVPLTPAREAETYPAPQILEAPPRWLPGSPVTKPGKPQFLPAPSFIPKPMPLIPLDQVPGEPGGKLPAKLLETTYCHWQ